MTDKINPTGQRNNSKKYLFIDEYDYKKDPKILDTFSDPVFCIFDGPSFDEQLDTIEDALKTLQRNRYSYIGLWRLIIVESDVFDNQILKNVSRILETPLMARAVGAIVRGR